MKSLLEKPIEKDKLKEAMHSEYPGKAVDALEMKSRFYAFKLLHAPRSGRVLAYWLMGVFFVCLIAVFFPWQQNIRASGFVTTLKPDERPQIVTNAIGGMIEEWYVREGQYVEAGQPLVRIREIKDKYMDPQTVERIGEQAEAKSQGVQNLREKAQALRKQIVALRAGLEFSLNKAENKVLQAQNKVKVDSASYAASQVDYNIAQTRLKRYEGLHEKGLVSLKDLESRRLKLQETEAKLEINKNKLEVARNELTNARIELNSIEAEYQDKIAKSESNLNESLYKMNVTAADVSKLRNEESSTRIRTSYYTVRAPQSGLVVRALKAGIGEVIKEGDAVVTVMPEGYTPAVELYVNATDVPLLSIGRKVRLQFDGWPAIQVSGWPSVSVGTFGGEIAVIDFVNSKEGKYRVLVIEDKDTDDPDHEIWPEQLRMGSGVFGWAMLDEVPIWYEIWRQLNGFPPSLQDPGAAKSTFPENKGKGGDKK